MQIIDKYQPQIQELHISLFFFIFNFVKFLWLSSDQQESFLLRKFSLWWASTSIVSIPSTSIQYT